MKKKGIKLSLKKAENADLKLVVVDAKNVDFRGFLNDLLKNDAILVVNKSDLLEKKLDTNIFKFNTITGSFTLNQRTGLIKQIFKTLRYSPKNNGWINKIGLRNPGIDYAIEEYKNMNTIVSIAILNKEEIDIINEKIPNNMNIEINVSCPNTDKKLISENVHKFINPNREWCILKLSPLTSKSEIDNYYENGWRQFHCSNTLPVSNGGLSGKTLIPYTKKLTSYISDNYKDSIVISGGGITKLDDIKNYRVCGAKHYSISTLLFHPIDFISFIYQLKTIDD